MQVRSYILFVILGSALVTFIPRVLPLMFLSKVEIPEWGEKWLNQIPVAVMSALLAQELLITNHKVFVFDNVIKLIAALPTFIVAVKTKNLLITVVVGILSMMLLRFIY
ncbi:MAG: AzlD domain-containing protein [Clostridiaceae bacterium]|nr:AzlD domain-containing protein [Clostridiaceae bacterium]